MVHFLHFDVVIYLLGNPKVYRGIVVNNKYLEILPYLSYLHNNIFLPGSVLRSEIALLFFLSFLSKPE